MKAYLELQVRGLEFNAQSPNLLASGADEGELCIWDLAKPSEPNLFPSLKVHFGLFLPSNTRHRDVTTSSLPIEHMLILEDIMTHLVLLYAY